MEFLLLSRDTICILLVLLYQSYFPAEGQNVRIVSYDHNSDRGSQPPPSPCPQIFQYQYGTNGWSGLIAVPPPANADPNLRKLLPVRLEVRLRLAGILPTKYVGKLELAETKEVVWRKVISGSTNRPILYRLHFPTTSPLPYLSLISMNGNVVCSGHFDNIPGRVLTAITLEHTFYPSANALNTRGDFNSGADDFNAANQQPANPFLGGDGSTGGTNIFQNGGSKEGTLPQVGSYINPGRRPNVYPQGSPQFGAQSGVFPTGQVSNNNPGMYRPSAGSSGFQSPAAISEQTFPASSSFHPGSEDEDRPEIGIKPEPTPELNPQQSSFLKNFLQGQDRNCGKPLASNLLVVKGRPVTKRGDWPWMVAIFENINDGVGIKFHCSGSLISRYYVLTAAHCTMAGDRELTPDRLLLYLGKFNLNKWTEPGAQTREVKQIYVHPNYGGNGGLGSDLAVLEMSGHAEYSPYVQPACIWPWRSTEEKVDYSDLTPLIGKLGTVVGWGRDENGNKVSSVPRLASVPIVSQEECLRSGQSYAYLTSNRTLCAGFRNGTGPCNGDSGGGLMFPVSDDEIGRNGNVRWFLRGIVSLSLLDFKKGTCDLNNYVIFTDVAKYGDWISQFIDLDLFYAFPSRQNKERTETTTTEASWLQPIDFRSLQSK